MPFLRETTLSKRSAFCQKSVGSLPPRSCLSRMSRMARQSWLPRLFRILLAGKPDDHSFACQGARKGAHSFCIRQGLFQDLFKDLFKDDLRGSPQG